MVQEQQQVMHTLMVMISSWLSPSPICVVVRVPSVPNCRTTEMQQLLTCQHQQQAFD